MFGLHGNPPFTAAIFDLDGTLVDSEPAWERAKRIVAARHGHAPTQAQIDSTIGRSLDDFIAEVFGASERAAMLDVREQIHRAADALLPQIRTAIPGAAAFLRALAQGGMQVAICSSSARRHIEGAVEMLGIGDCVGLIVSAAELDRGKPDPMPYRVTVQRLDLPAASVCAFEDAVPGALSAKGAGLATIAVGPGCTSGAFGFCDLQAESYDDLRRMLDV